jgi:hypothetical protein
MKNDVVSKYFVKEYLKIFGLSRLKQVIYIMRTSEDEYPRNKYLNWGNYVKAGKDYKNSKKPLYADGFYNWFICSDTIEELEYQINKQASEQKG